MQGRHRRPCSRLHCALAGLVLLPFLALVHPAQAQTEMREALVITNASGSDALWSRISELVDVKQRLPPRLAIVQGEPDALDNLRKEQGVVDVSEETVPDTALRQLNPTERLFSGCLRGTPPRAESQSPRGWPSVGCRRVPAARPAASPPQRAVAPRVPAHSLISRPAVYSRRRIVLPDSSKRMWRGVFRLRPGFGGPP